MVDPTSIQPTLEEIASNIVMFTRNEHGETLGTFTEDTTPTDVEAEAQALRAARYVATRVASPSIEWTDDLVAMARDATAVYAALLIATGYYGDSSDPDETRIDQLGRLAREQIGTLVAASKDNLPGGIRFHSIQQVNR